jgi:hypothetical protein
VAEEWERIEVWKNAEEGDQSSGGLGEEMGSEDA